MDIGMFDPSTKKVLVNFDKWVGIGDTIWKISYSDGASSSKLLDIRIERTFLVSTNTLSEDVVVGITDIKTDSCVSNRYTNEWKLVFATKEDAETVKIGGGKSVKVGDTVWILRSAWNGKRDRYHVVKKEVTKIRYGHWKGGSFLVYNKPLIWCAYPGYKNQQLPTCLADMFQSLDDLFEFSPKKPQFSMTMLKKKPLELQLV